MTFEVDIDRDGKLDTLIVTADTFNGAEDRALEYLSSQQIDADIVAIVVASDHAGVAV